MIRTAPNTPSASHLRPLHRSADWSAGTSDVYVTGYKTTSSMLPGQYPYFDGADTSDEDEDEEEDEDDDEPPQAIPIGKKRRAAIIAVRSVTDLTP